MIVPVTTLRFDWQIVTMEDIRAKLAGRLTAKGREDNETELFIKDVMADSSVSPKWFWKLPRMSS